MASPPLRLPSDFIEVANATATLDASTFESIMQVLESHGGEVSRRGLARKIAATVGWEPLLSDRLLWMIVSLNVMYKDFDYPDWETLAAS